MKIHPASAVPLLLAAVAGCSNPPVPALTPSFTPLPAVTANPTAASTQPPTAAPKPEPAEIPLSDNFVDNRNHWKELEGVLKATPQIADGRLTFSFADEVNSGFASLPGRYDDVHLEFDVAMESGAESAYVEAYCRLSDLGAADWSGYHFTIFGDGFFRIDKTVNGESSELWAPVFSNTFHTGRDPNKIEVICAGEELRLIVNDHILVYLSDSDLKAGMVGLGAGKGEAAKTAVVTLSSFELSAPEVDTISSLPTPLGGGVPMIFPVRPPVGNFIDYGDGHVNFDTPYTLEAVASYYRNVLPKNGLSEAGDKALVTETSLRMVFELLEYTWVITGVYVPGEGHVNIDIREQ